MQLMTPPAPAPFPVPAFTALYEDCRFWLKAMRAWKDVIGRIIDETGNANGSPDLVAQVARVAGELSLLEDRLNPLIREVECHSNLLLANGDDIELQLRHQVLQTRVLEEGGYFRNHLAEIFRLEGYAYKKFLS